MNNCFSAADPLACEYYPHCSEGHIHRQDLNPEETRSFTYPGPCVLYLQSGEVDMKCNNITLQNIIAPDFILIPATGFNITARSAVKAFIFGPDVVRLLAEKIGTDFKKNRTGSPAFAKPIRFIGHDVAIKQSKVIIADCFACRRYTEFKFREFIHTINPDMYDYISKTLASKDWFFRVRVSALLNVRGSLSEFADAFAMSESGFSKRFRRVYGTSFYQWLLDRKFEAVSSDMLRTELSFSELAVKHGFYSVQHFGFFIKKKTGLSPGRLRSDIRKQRRY